MSQTNTRKSDYRFVSTWQLAAPVEAVWEEVYHSENWPSWWKGVVEVTDLEKGDANGLGHLRRFVWKSRLPYKLVTNIRSTRVEPLKALEGEISGELEGTGRWSFSSEKNTTVVRFEEIVRTIKRWIRFLAPVASPLFRYNHHVIMRWGAEGLAQRLGVELMRCEEE